MMYIIDAVDMFDLPTDDDDLDAVNGRFLEKGDPEEDNDHRSSNSLKKEEIIVKKAINGNVLYVDTIISASKILRRRVFETLPTRDHDAAQKNIHVIEVLRSNRPGRGLGINDMIDQIGKNAKDCPCLIVRNMSDIIQIVHREAFADLSISGIKSITKDEMKARNEKIQEFSDEFINVTSSFKESILFNTASSLVYDRKTGNLQQAKNYAQFYSMIDDDRSVDFYKKWFGLVSYTRKSIDDFHAEIVKKT